MRTDVALTCGKKGRSPLCEGMCRLLVKGMAPVDRLKKTW